MGLAMPLDGSFKTVLVPAGLFVVLRSFNSLVGVFDGIDLVLSSGAWSLTPTLGGTDFPPIFETLAIDDSILVLFLTI